jgi:hypothetical protein
LCGPLTRRRRTRWSSLSARCQTHCERADSESRHPCRTPTPSSRFWRDARCTGWCLDTPGRVLKTELVVGDDNGNIRIVTWYRPDERLEMLVPARMSESYDYVQRIYDAIECEATYSNFRRFETGARIVPPK